MKTKRILKYALVLIIGFIIGFITGLYAGFTMADGLAKAANEHFKVKQQIKSKSKTYSDSTNIVLQETINIPARQIYVEDLDK